MVHLGQLEFSMQLAREFKPFVLLGTRRVFSEDQTHYVQLAATFQNLPFGQTIAGLAKVSDLKN